MTTKDYMLIANTIRDTWTPQDYDAIRRVASAMAIQFLKENHRFDENKFMLACGFNL